MLQDLPWGLCCSRPIALHLAACNQRCAAVVVVGNSYCVASAVAERTGRSAALTYQLAY